MNNDSRFEIILFVEEIESYIHIDYCNSWEGVQKYRLRAGLEFVDHLTGRSGKCSDLPSTKIIE